MKPSAALILSCGELENYTPYIEALLSETCRNHARASDLAWKSGRLVHIFTVCSSRLLHVPALPA